VNKNYINNFIRKAFRLITGLESPSVNLEQWLFTSIMFLCIVACFIATVENIIVKLHPILICGTLIAFFLFILFWFLSRRGISYKRTIYFAIISIIGTLIVVWFFNAGSLGGTQLFLLICPLFILVFLHGVGQKILFGIFYIIVTFLFIVEYTNPNLIVNYKSEFERFTDVHITFYLASLVSVFFVLVLYRGYKSSIEKAFLEKKQSEKRFFETADMLPVCICEINANLIISFLNKAGYKLLNISDEALEKGISILECFHQDDKIKVYNYFNDLLREKNIPLREFRLLCNSKKKKNIILQADPILVDSKINGFRLCMIDITDKTSLEEQYNQAQKMESLGLLAGGVAHDFNNILTGIIGYANLIKLKNKNNSIFDKNLDDHVTEIIKAGQRASELIKKLLAFSRQGAYEVKPINIHTLIDDVVTILTHSIDKRIHIAKNLTALNPIVDGDQSLLQSALLNLAINSRDAMPNGGSLIFSTTCIKVDEIFASKRNFPIEKGNYVAVSVVDTGCGMDDNVKNHLFEPFFTTKEHGKGTGLGLASVFGTVKRHNGFIEIESEKGKGTKVTLYLPQSSTIPSFEKPKNIYKEKLKKIHILFIDDEATICEFVKDFFVSEGHNLTAFTNPLQAIEWYKSHFLEVDCIVLDLNIPLMDGKTCFKELQKINPDAVAIFATGFMVSDTAQIIRMPGVKGYIQKPFTGENLLETIISMIYN
jgi:PAS domain S-box-containing protein